MKRTLLLVFAVVCISGFMITACGKKESPTEPAPVPTATPVPIPTATPLPTATPSPNVEYEIITAPINSSQPYLQAISQTIYWRTSYPVFFQKGATFPWRMAAYVNYSIGSAGFSFSGSYMQNSDRALSDNTVLTMNLYKFGVKIKTATYTGSEIYAGTEDLTDYESNQ